ncbi:MAG: Planctomycete cytochrome [Planctomycetaceae bacterium]|nr:Planctomycete cytochrome [Planctomycetaceae bacterium]
MNDVRSQIMLRSGILAAGLICTSFASLSGADMLEFNRDIRPILAENCFRCHGPDSAARKADLRLDKRDNAIQLKAIIPSKPDESELVARILTADPEQIMPPPNSHKKLTAEQKEKLKLWIAQGAEYQPHWSFIAPQRPMPPAVKNAAWIRNPIDNFVLAKLESMGLAPAPEADRRTLARRVSLDLTGLPPVPALVEKFVQDQAQDAYEKYVDEVLKSPNWGEHRARYWLDAARYADTHGIHFDNYREIWAYRNWVIEAFNRNLPFDQFTIEQLAGDLLPNKTLEQQIASGFNRCNITTSEGGTIAEEYLVLYTRDRTETTSLVWMGLTTGCAVCHDHKFDPITQREFYELAAFFNNTTQGAMDGNVKDTPPIVAVPLIEDLPRWQLIGSEIVAARDAAEARKKEARPLFDEWLAKATPETVSGAIPTKNLYLSAPLNEGQGAVTKINVDGQSRDISLTASSKWAPGLTSSQALLTQGGACEIPDAGDFDKDQPFTVSAWVKLPANDGVGAICSRMDKGPEYRGWDFWVQGRRIGMHLVNKWPEDALKAVGKNQIPANEWTHVCVSYDGSGKAAGLKIFYNGQPQETLVENDKLKSTIKSPVPFKIGQRSVSEPLSAAGVQDLRIYKQALVAADVETLAKVTRFSAVLAKAADKRTDAEKNEVFPWWLATSDETYKQRLAKVAALEQEQNTIKARSTIAHVMSERGDDATAFILYRGEYDKRRDPVKALTPAVLPPFPKEAPHNRLGLAQWLLRPEHPLTARVTANRFWQEVFGTGIVRTSGDFGISGELPANQELLDWMAVQLREEGWDVKRFFKLLVTSATYRQAALTTPLKLEKDPLNRFLSRGPRFRMDAEMVRDYALAASGLLVSKIGGPSVKPYQPEGVWEAVAMIGSNTRDYRRDTGDNLYRRSLYTFWKRSAPPASMDIFNAPSRETCTVRRERTNTPLQALVTLNDPQFIEAAKNLAQVAMKSAGESTDGRLDVIAKRLLSRSFRPEELQVVKASLSDLMQYYRLHEDDAKLLLGVGDAKPEPMMDAATLAAWTMLTNEVLNLDEVLNK